MTINEVNLQDALPQPVKGKRGKEPAKSVPEATDKVKVSAEAKSLFEADQQKRVEEIREKIRTHYYFSDEVTERVAEAIIRDLTK